MAKLANVETTTTSNAKDRAPAVAYINVGKRVKSENDPEKSFMLSPVFGIAITEQAEKKRLSKQEQSLYAAVLAKVEAIKAAGGAGQSHTINLDVEIFIPSDEEKVVEAGNFDL